MSYARSVVAVFLIGLVFLGSMLVSTGGRASLPLDDSFIYFQYARQAASGEFFSYQPGDAPTTGSTSVPWMLMLALGSLLGMDGKAMIFVAMILAGLFLAAAVRWVGRVGRSDGGAPAPPGSDSGTAAGTASRWPLASVLLLLSGPMHWGTWSGMEIAYFAAMIAWTFSELARTDGLPTRRSAIAGALLATARPEGALLVVALAGLWAVRAFSDPDARRRVVWVLVPVLFVFAQPALNFALTGETRSSGFLAKTLLAAPHADLWGVLRQVLLRGTSLGLALLGGIGPFADARGLYAYDSESISLWVAPGAGLLFLLGVLPAVARELAARRPGPATVLLAWVAVLIYGSCILDEPDAHFSRYQMPLLPLFAVGVAWGVARLARHASLAAVRNGARLWLVGMGAVSVLFFAGAYGDNCQDIDRMQIRFGETLRDTLPPGSVVAINDAGAIAYFSGHRVLDLVGLVSPGMAGRWTQGSGVLWETLENLPPGDRPEWFCFFPNWFEFDGIGILRRVGSVRLLAPSIVDAEKVLATADWSLAGSGDAPRLGAGVSRVVDRLDVADPESEMAHGFRWSHGQRGRDGGSFLRRATFRSDAGALPDEAIDGGRSIFESAEFDLARSPEGVTAVIVRTPSGVRQRVRVSVDGGAEEPVEIYGAGGGAFHEQAVAVLPAGTEPAHVRLRLVDEAAGSAPLILLHVFALVEDAG